MIIQLNDAELVWEFDENNTNAAEISDNNLKLVKNSEILWNMRDIVGYDDCCVGVHLLSKNEFYFVTFNGLGFTMRVEGNEVTCVKSVITK